MNQTQTIQDVINGVLQTVKIIAPLAALGTFGITQLVKEMGLPRKWAGLFAYVAGFFISILVTGMATHDYWSGISILTGILVAFGTPGLYSGIKAMATKTPPTE